MEKLIIFLFAFAVARILFLLVSPVGRCLRCHGRKVVPYGHGVTRCHRCRGMGLTPRLGAPVVHRLAHEHAWPWLRERIMPRTEQEEDR